MNKEKLVTLANLYIYIYIYIYIKSILIKENNMQKGINFHGNKYKVVEEK